MFMVKHSIFTEIQFKSKPIAKNIREVYSHLRYSEQQQNSRLQCVRRQFEGFFLQRKSLLHIYLSKILTN